MAQPAFQLQRNLLDFVLFVDKNRAVATLEELNKETETLYILRALNDEAYYLPELNAVSSPH
jgi:hypothetical protein